MTGYYLGVDIGTTNVKTALYDNDFNFLAEESCEYDTIYLKPGWVEQNPRSWWDAFCSDVKSLKGCFPDELRRLGGICISSHAPAVVPMDERGEPLRNALIWMDRRSETSIPYMRENPGNSVVQKITGNRIDPYYSSAKLLWIKNEEPHIWTKIHCVLQANSYLNYCLTGECSNDQAHAGLTGLFDIETEQWSSLLCRVWGIPERILPPVSPSSEIIGSVTEKASSQTGLPPGVPVMAGTVDASAAALEAGVLEPGEALETTGTSSVLMIGCKDMPRTDTLVALYHALQDKALLIGPISSTGSSLKWFRDTLGRAECEDADETGVAPYAIMDREASVAGGSSNLIFLPYMAGERAPLWDTDARGVFFGLTLGTSRGNMIRAILEGGAFALRHNIEEAENAGHTISRITAAGGGAGSDLWLQIKASALGIPVIRMRNSSSGALGNALVAAMGSGDLKSPESVLKRFLVYEKTFEPDDLLQNHLDKKYQLFRNLYEHTREDFKTMARMTQPVYVKE